MNIKEFIVAPENDISSVIEQILINSHRAVIVVKKKKVFVQGNRTPQILDLDRLIELLEAVESQ